MEMTLKGNNNISKPSIDTTNSPSCFITTYDLYNCKLATVRDENSSKVLFVGHATDSAFIDHFTGQSVATAFDFMKRAVNNRTIERDYFKLYCEMLMGNITEDEFERELDNNEDLYVVSEDIDPTEDDIRLALQLSQGLKDVKTSEDLSSLFSLNVLKTEKLLNK